MHSEKKVKLLEIRSKKDVYCKKPKSRFMSIKQTVQPKEGKLTSDPYKRLLIFCKWTRQL